jgi:hypothetical protein
MKRMELMALVCAAAWVGATAEAARAQEAEEKQQEEDVLSLDALLGLEEEPGEGAAETIDEDLARALGGTSPGDRFRQAAMLMDRSARRLREAKDAGLGTQRLQAEALRKLDQLIEESRSGQGSSSSGRARREADRRSQPDQPAAGSQRQENEPGRGDNTAELMPPAQRPAVLNPSVAGSADWGNLPQRVRDALMQGASGSFSATYRALTEAYYRRLAEEERR